jgi:predicted PurR-regulated permease PerM
MDPTKRTVQQIGLWILLVLVAGGVLYGLSSILMPFLLAAILAYICNPLVVMMTRYRLPRAFAATLVLILLVFLFVVLLLVVLPLLIRQVKGIAGQLPQLATWLHTVVSPLLQHYFGWNVETVVLRDWTVSHSDEIRDVLLKVLPSIKTGGLAIFELLSVLVLVPVLLFYFLRDWVTLVASVERLIPRRWHAAARTISLEIDMVLGEFLRGQLLVMLAMAMFYSVGLWFAGLDYALSVGMIAGLVTFVPYLGVIIGVVLATLTGFLQFPEWTQLFWVWGVFVVANVLEGSILVPWLVGDRIGLHPVAVMFALLAFGSVFGFFGVLLALPASAALWVWGQHIGHQYLESTLYRD